jgi:protein-tyrosine kinase
MSAERAEEMSIDPDDQLRNLLIRRCALSLEAVSKIGKAQEMLGASFCDAALRLGYITQEDIDSAAAWRRRLAVIEGKRVAPGSELALAHDPYSLHSEKVRALRTELLLRHKAPDRANVVALLSPCSGEGRSRLAAELAISFAQLGQPTLLVDADLRRPRQHMLFDSENKRGLTQAIAKGEAPYFHSVENLPRMSLLTAGPSPTNPLELLSDSRFESLIEDWHRRFKFIVFDTPPVSDYSDGLAVATVVGRVLVLGRAKCTPYKETREMLRRLAATQSQILGAVLNHF